MTKRVSTHSVSHLYCVSRYARAPSLRGRVGACKEARAAREIRRGWMGARSVQYDDARGRSLTR